MLKEYLNPNPFGMQIPNDAIERLANAPKASVEPVRWKRQEVVSNFKPPTGRTHEWWIELKDGSVVPRDCIPFEMWPQIPQKM